MNPINAISLTIKNRQAIAFEHKIRTRYAETGQDGIIHHSSYVVYLEEARMEFFKKLGFDINELEQQKIFCPVIDLSLKYLKPLNSLEDIVISVMVEKFSKVRFSLRYQISSAGTPVTVATISHCFLNGAFKPIGIPGEFLSQLKEWS